MPHLLDRLFLFLSLRVYYFVGERTQLVSINIKMCLLYVSLNELKLPTGRYRIPEFDSPIIPHREDLPVVRVTAYQPTAYLPSAY